MGQIKVKANESHYSYIFKLKSRENCESIQGEKKKKRMH